MDCKRWRGLTRISNDELQKYKLKRSRCASRDRGSLTFSKTTVKLDHGVKFNNSHFKIDSLDID